MKMPKLIFALFVALMLLNMKAEAQIDLSRPSTNSKNLGTTVALWAEYEGSSKYTYQLQVSDDSTFATTQFSDTNNRYYVVAYGLKLSTKYFWRMRRWKGTDTTIWSAVWNFTTNDKPIIQGPRDSSVLNEYARVFLNKTNLKNFEIWLDTLADFSSSGIVKTSFKDTSKTSDFEWKPAGYYFNKNYYLKYRTFETGDTSPWSNTHYFKVIFAVPVYHNSPKYFNFTYASPGIQWLFDESKKLEYYELEFDTDKNFNSTDKKRIIYDDIKYGDTISIGDLKFNTYYHWRVRAKNALDISPWWYGDSLRTGDGSHGPNWPWFLYPNHDLVFFSDTFANRVKFELDTSSNYNSPELFTYNFTPTSNGGFRSRDTIRLRKLFYNTLNHIKYTIYNDVDSLVRGRNIKTNMHADMDEPYSYKPNNIDVPLRVDTSFKNGNYFRMQLDTSPLFNSPLFWDTTILESNGFNGSFIKTKLKFSTTYYWRLQNGHEKDTSDWGLRVFETYGSPQLVKPNNGVEFNTLRYRLEWEELQNTQYHLQVDTSIHFNSNQLANTYITDYQRTFDSTNCKLFNTKYYWRVRVYGENDSSEWSEIRNFITADQIFRIKPEDGDTNVYPSSIDWLSIEGTKGYLLQIDTSEMLSGPVKKWIIEKNRPFFHNFYDNNYSLDFSTPYFFQLGVFTESDTLYSDTIRFTTRKRNGVALTSPNNNATNQAWLTPLRWVPFPSSNAKKYRVEVSEHPDMRDSLVYIATGITTTASLQPAKTYYWRVRAMFNDIIPVSDYSVTRKFSTNDGLDAPVLMLPADSSYIGNNQFTFTWMAVSNANSYELQVGFDPGFNGFRTFTTSSPSQSVDLLSEGQTYFWRVRAISGGIRSPWSVVRRFEVNLNSNYKQIDNEKIVVTPNPSDGKFIIQSNASAIHKIEIFDIKGQVVFQQNIKGFNKQQVINHQLSPGVYILHTQLEGKTIVTKVIIQ
jgi:hypothetical protein